MARIKSAFAWSPVRRLMQSQGAEIVSRTAVRTLLDYLEARARTITEMGVEFAKHAGRRKVNVADVQLAIDNV